MRTDFLRPPGQVGGLARQGLGLARLERGPFLRLRRLLRLALLGDPGFARPALLLAQHVRPGRALMARRRAGAAPVLEAQMLDPHERRLVLRRQLLVERLGDQGAEILGELAGTLEIVPFARLLAQPLGRKPPRRRQQVAMPVGVTP